MSNVQLTALEEQIKTLRANYERVAREFLAVVQRRSKKDERVAAFYVWHAAGVELFNAHDKAIAIGALDKADLNPTWYTDRAETAANWLETICLHYRTLRDRTVELGINSATIRPSLTAYANLQRIVIETHPDIARRLRDEFVQLYLPTHGFDKAGSEKTPSGFDLPGFALGSVFLAFTFGVFLWAFAVRDLSSDQRMLMLWLLPIAGGFGSRSFVGAISAKVKKGIPGVIVTATGGFAIWLLTYFLLPKP
jgi:hypothetical protein